MANLSFCRHNSLEVIGSYWQQDAAMGVSDLDEDLEVYSLLFAVDSLAALCVATLLQYFILI